MSCLDGGVLLTIIEGGITITVCIYWQDHSCTYSEMVRNERGSIMKRSRHAICDSKGFSLVELIIVVAIMAILAGALAPALIKYIEKSRRAKDIKNAKAIEDVLVYAFSEGTIQLPPGERRSGYGAWVMLCNKTKDNAPVPYHSKNFSGIWCGADKGVIIDGQVSNNDWAYCQELDNFLKSEGVNVANGRTYSKGDADGWDWIIVQVCFDSNGRLCSRIYSGYKNQDGGINKTPETNIEKALGRGWIPIS